MQRELSIGRDRQNTLAIEDRVLSRRYCAIQEADGRCSLRDLGSSDGTYVNGLPVTMPTLSDGDQITAGQNLFLFASGAVAHSGSGAIELDRGGINPMSTQILARARDLWQFFRSQIDGILGLQHHCQGHIEEIAEPIASRTSSM